MCGIVGFWEPGGLQGRSDEVIRAMTARLHHRGPDAAGYWLDVSRGLALGHRRLAIVDLSDEGAQPMVSASGRFVAVYNGEIYNFRALRRELIALGHTFRGESDTEVLLTAIEEWGVIAAIKKLAGMFAAAVFDRADDSLYLFRDRIGEKPLYWGVSNETFFFASELKALVPHPSWRGELDREAITLFMRYGYIPAPYSIFRGIRKTQPGTCLHFPLARGIGAPPDIFHYWEPSDQGHNSGSAATSQSIPEYITTLDTRLRQTVAEEMVADVPLGAFLSGGIDSSLVVALMQAQSNRPIRTFTIGFREDRFNEAVFAKRVAEHLGTDHTELYISPSDMLGVVDKLPTIYDEPFADSSQIPTYLVASLARRHVTVSLSGDGGDELFAGYDRYRLIGDMWRHLNHYPLPVRHAAAWALSTPSEPQWDAIFRLVRPILRPFLPPWTRSRLTGDRIHKAARLLATRTPELLSREIISLWPSPAATVIGGGEPTPVAPSDTPNRSALLLDRLMYLDQQTYLPDDLLVKVDRASMAVSLETRAPFLDHRVVECAWNIPASLKYRDGQGKWILRQLLHRYVPPGLVEHPKMGFSVPLSEWLRGPLRDWADALLDGPRLEQEGIFDADTIRRFWQQHRSCEREWEHQLWTVLMFQAWNASQQNDTAVEPAYARVVRHDGSTAPT